MMKSPSTASDICKPFEVSYIDEIDDESIFDVLRTIRRRGGLPPPIREVDTTLVSDGLGKGRNKWTHTIEFSTDNHSVKAQNDRLLINGKARHDQYQTDEKVSSLDDNNNYDAFAKIKGRLDFAFCGLLTGSQENSGFNRKTPSEKSFSWLGSLDSTDDASEMTDSQTASDWLSYIVNKIVTVKRISENGSYFDTNRRVAEEILKCRFHSARKCSSDDDSIYASEFDEIPTLVPLCWQRTTMSSSSESHKSIQKSKISLEATHLSSEDDEVVESICKDATLNSISGLNEVKLKHHMNFVGTQTHPFGFGDDRSVLSLGDFDDLVPLVLVNVLSSEFEMRNNLDDVCATLNGEIQVCEESDNSIAIPM